MQGSLRAAPVSGFRGARLAAPRPVARPSSARTAAAPPAAFLGGLFGGGGAKSGSGDAKGGRKAAAPQYMICIDCGWIYDGDFKAAPGSFKCPVCKAPKSRFKAYKGALRGRPNNSGAEMKRRFQARQW